MLFATPTPPSGCKLDFKLLSLEDPFMRPKIHDLVEYLLKKRQSFPLVEIWFNDPLVSHVGCHIFHQHDLMHEILDKYLLSLIWPRETWIRKLLFRVVSAL